MPWTTLSLSGFVITDRHVSKSETTARSVETSSVAADAIAAPAEAGSSIQVGIFRSSVSPRTVTAWPAGPAAPVTSSVRPQSG